VSVRLTSSWAVAMVDSVSGVAFGPVFENTTEAEMFLEHLQAIGERDPRVIPAGELIDLANEWKAEQ